MKIVWLILLFLAATEFIVRGPWRAVSESGDFSTPYLSARVWISGGNPYDHEPFDRLWQEAGGAPESKPVKSNTPSVYPPTAFAIIAPLALFSWPVARATLLAINSLLALILLAALISAAGFGWFEPRGKGVLVLGTAFAPLHTGIAYGNLIVPASAGIMLAIWASAKKRDSLAGVLLAVATGLKPQIGGIILLGYALERRWRICVVAGVLLLALAGLSVLRLEIASVDWWQSWMSNAAGAAVAGNTNDPTSANPSRHHLINLHWPLYAIFHQAWAVKAIILAFAASLFLIYLMTLRKQTSRQELLSLSALAVLSLAVIYHRFYDAVLLLLPLAWSLKAWHGELRRAARFSFLLILPFLIPGAVMLQEQVRTGRWPAALNETWWWKALLLPHQIWAIALLAVCLAYAQIQLRREAN